MEGGRLAAKTHQQSSQAVSEETHQHRIAAWPLYLSSLALWASHAPLQQAWLAWFAPIGYLWFAEKSQTARFGPREWFHGWLAGCLFWLPILQGIRLAYWPLYAGWLALALYLAIYTPTFLWGLRNLRHRGLPLLLAAPLLWVGLEYLRSYVLTGYSASMLAHTQAHAPRMIQLADMLGGYGVSWVVMTGSVGCWFLLDSLMSSFRKSEVRQGMSLINILSAIVLVGLNYGYGRWRLEQAATAADAPTLKVLLLQENTPSMFDTKTSQDLHAAWNSYLALTLQQIQEHGAVDLIAWPESTFTGTLPWHDPKLPDHLPPELLESQIDMNMIVQGTQRSNLEFTDKCRKVLGSVGTQLAVQGHTGNLPSLLAGCDVMGVTEKELVHYNSVLWVNPEAQVSDRYNKMHLVVFGEFLPWGFDWLGDMFGFWGAEAGDQPKCFQINGTNVAPNICFETMMPRVIQSQVSQLARAGSNPDVLVNFTNDSWFRGSSMLDHHLACTILCAVENRRPILVAANTGLSAEINGSGEVLQYIERSEVGGILATPQRDGRWGLVQAVGYPLGWFGALLVVLACCPARKHSQQKTDNAASDG